MKKIIFLLIAFTIITGYKQVYSQMAGEYTINPLLPETGNNFQSFTSAINALNGVISGDVNIVVSENIDSYIEPIEIYNINAGFSVRFVADPLTNNVNVLYQPFDNKGVVNISNTTNLTFEGINFTNSSSTNLSSVVNFTGGNSNIKFINCTFISQNMTSFYDDAQSLIYHNSTINSNYVNDLFFENCTFNGGYNGVNVQGFAEEIGLKISKSNFYNQNNAGINIIKQSNVEILNNYISPSASSNQNVGIIATYCSDNLKINGNKIILTGHNNNYGIVLSNSGTTAFTKNEIINNMISNQNSMNEVYGIKLENTFEVNVFNNSVNIGYGYGAVFGVFGASYLGVTVMNNIFSSGSAFNYKISNGGILLDCDNNLVYNTGESIGEISGSPFYSFELWKNNSGLDANSFFGQPNFISTTDLHLDPSMPSLAESKAQYLYPILLKDIDNNFRHGTSGYLGNGTAPDIGADEGDFIKIYTGEITENIVWDGKVGLMGNIRILPNVNVTVTPGTELMMVDSVTIVVDGSIYAVGNSEQLIKIGYESGSAWKGIYFTNSADLSASYFSYCYFTRGINDNVPEKGGVFTIDVANGKEIVIEHSIFEYNSAEQGGAIYCNSGSPLIKSNKFNYNSADIGGGAIYITNNSNPLIINNLFISNNSNYYSGAIFLDMNAIAVDIVNNTFYYNSSNNDGKSIYSNTTMINNKLINNIISGSIGELVIFSENMKFDAYNNNISNLVELLAANVFNVNMGNINAEPMFVDIGSDNFGLMNGSGCIDAGVDISIFGIAEDYLGNPRVYNSIIDIGALEYSEVVANAGDNQEYCSSIFTMAANTVGTTQIGTWSIISGSGTFSDINDPYAVVSNVQIGQNVLRWTVTEGENFASDDVMITNQQPYVYAGDDQLLVSENYPNLISSTFLNANQPLLSSSGTWSNIVGGGNIQQISLPNSYVSGISYGENIYRWSIYDWNTSCVNFDDVSIYTGYSMVPATGVTTIDWTNPSDWYPPSVPGIGDSVTVYGANVYIDGGTNANVGTLYIGSGSNLYIGGTNGSGNLNALNVLIEENPVKFKNNKGPANCYLTDGTITIPEQLNENQPGIYIGTGATLEIGNAVTKAYANINVGSGRSIVLEQTAEKGTTKGSSANLTVRNGGSLVLEQTAEKNSKSATSGITIRNGGSLVLEQTAEKATQGINLGSGRSLVLEQTAEKGGAAPSLTIRGGSLVLEQTAEKGNKAVAGGLTIRGGSLVLEQTAEKDYAPSELYTPNITLTDGKIIIGDASGSKAVYSKIYTTSLVLEQTAEKGLVQDSSLFVYGNGGLYFNNSANVDYSEFRIRNNATVTVLEGGDFNLNDGVNNHELVLEEEASFIDFNQTTQVQGNIERNFVANELQYFCTPFLTAEVSEFDDFSTFKCWSESNSIWYNLENDDNILPLQGSKLGYSYDKIEYVSGIFTTGFQTIQVYKTAFDPILQGLNCVGNPYPSAIDWDLVTLNEDIHKTAYFFDPVTNAISMYQQGGVSINGADQYILTSEAFSIKTDATNNFEVDNSARVHYFNNPVKEKETFDNYIKLKVSNLVLSDETVIRFTNLASENFENEFDAVKLFTNVLPSQLYSYSNADLSEPLAINTINLPVGSYTIPFALNNTIMGQHTIDASEMNFPPNVGVTLKNLENNESQDLKANPVYAFNLLNTVGEYNFELVFDGFVGIDETFDYGDVNVYSSGKDIFFILNTKLPLNYQVYDINGKLILTNKLYTEGTSQISTNLQTGIYFVRTQSDEIVNNFKIFIQN